MENVRCTTYEKIYWQQVCQLIVHIQREEFGVPITLEDQPDLNSIETFYQKGNGNFWIALSEDTVVGTIALIDIGKNQVALRKMFVARNYRGQPHAVGQKLMDVVFQWTLKNSITEVILGTLDKFVAAQAFYRKNGFQEIAKEDLPANFPAMKLDNKFFIRKQPDVTIVEFENALHQSYFENLNRQWIEKYFWMEPVDFEVLQQPVEHIIDRGGSILMASCGNHIAGTVALKRFDTKTFEFTKMAVDENYRGKKIGEKLALAAIEKAKAMGAERVFLYSNTVLSPAISLYKKIGFTEIPVDGPYKRSNIKMELLIK